MAQTSKVSYAPMSIGESNRISVDDHLHKSKWEQQNYKLLCEFAHEVMNVFQNGGLILADSEILYDGSVSDDVWNGW